MKLLVPCVLALLAAGGISHAGSFGGPPPFTDLSPLQSGIDGSYQATVRGENCTGVFRFQYQNGVQTPAGPGNAYSIFVAGNTVSGSVTVSIQGKEVAGVFEGQNFEVPTNNQGSANLPLVFIVRGSRGNGFFEGRMDLEDRLSFFSGTGTIGPAAEETNTVVGINEPNPSLAVTQTTTTSNAVIIPSIEVIVTNFTIPGSAIPPTDFTFTGVRSSTQVQTFAETNALITP